MAAACPLLAVEPVLNDLQPRGGQRGKTFTLTLKGEGLAAGADLMTPLPCTITKLAPPRDAEMPGSELAYLIHLPDDAAVGAYPAARPNRGRPVQRADFHRQRLARNRGKRAQ